MACSVHDNRNPLSRHGGFEPILVNIGDAIALGIGAADLRSPGEVGAEAIGRAESGAFANQDYGETGSDAFADFVTNSHAALADDADRCDAPGLEMLH